MAVHHLEAHLNVDVGLSASMKSRHNLALQHLWNARHAARQCRDREADLASLKYRLPEVEPTGLAMVAVMSSVAFLEALVNEVYLDTVDAETMSQSRVEGMSDGAIAAMRNQWKATPSVQREEILLPSTGPAEIDARLRLLIGRCGSMAGLANVGTARLGELVIDDATYTVRLRERQIYLTYKEFELMKYLVQHAGRVFTRRQLLQEVWDVTSSAAPAPLTCTCAGYGPSSAPSTSR